MKEDNKTHKRPWISYLKLFYEVRGGKRFLSVLGILLLGAIFLLSSSPTQSRAKAKSPYNPAAVQSALKFSNSLKQKVRNVQMPPPQPDAVSLLGSELTPYEKVAGSPYNVSYDHRAFTANGERLLLQVGAVHYPRATPLMWPRLMELSRKGGLNTIDTYVFWNYHETVKGKYDFETGSRDLPLFLELAAEYGLFVQLRIGPYVCAEWTGGGIPIWMFLEPDVQFRTYNKVWMEHMERWTNDLLARVAPYLATNGGPIILLQIENEYGNIQKEYGEAGDRYANWAAEMAQRLEPNIPWMMCMQSKTPPGIVEAVNGYYADYWLPGFFRQQRGYPGAWTEDWPGWFLVWGEPQAHRPAQDVAYAVAKWFMRGGTLQTYYMWFGGTTFGRWVGGPWIATSYDYDVALNEYGYASEPKYTHLKKLHFALDRFKDALLQDQVPKEKMVGKKQGIHVWGKLGDSGSVIFMENGDTNPINVTWNGHTWKLRGWSVLIIDGEHADPESVVYDSSVLPKLSEMEKTLQEDEIIKVDPQSIYALEEPVGGWDNVKIVRSTKPKTALPLIKQSTDYLWYTTKFNVSKMDPTADSKHKHTVKILNRGHDNHNWIMVFVDKKFIGQNRIPRGVDIDLSFDLGSYDEHDLDIFCQNMGMRNYAMDLEQDVRGLNGDILMDGVSILENGWDHKIGLRGEVENWNNGFPNTNEKSNQIDSYIGAKMVWFEMKFNAVVEESKMDEIAFVVDMSSMGKGDVWVNGHMLGRYWDIKNGGKCNPCDYRGSWGPGQCRTGCGEITQRYYHLPPDWINWESPFDNRIVVFTETGGDPKGVEIVKYKLKSQV